MKQLHEQDVVTEREIPRARLGAIGWLVLALVVVAVAAWEWKMRDLGLVAGDLGDGKSAWAVERRKIASGDHDGVVIVGGSRILFDTNLDVWAEMTGRRPVQLALPGMSGQQFLRDLAVNSRFDGFVLIDVTPEQFFRVGRGHPAFEGVLDYWEDEGPAKRTGHHIGRFLSRYLAFLDNQYSLTELIDQLEIRNRGKIPGPFLRPWKLSENYEDRQYHLWREIETNESLREHAIRVWLGRGLGPPDEALIARICADVRGSVAMIRARGGDVVFIRPPSSGGYYEREQQNTPRDRTWDRMLREADVLGIHFEDYPDMQGFELPELSHLTREDAVRFTRAYVGVLREWYVGLRPPPVLEPAG
ncbi:MAG TPA: hypothetical protein VNO53_00315 [Steroidobacteraceae bacterium]|nr:hypothetical protein [Steroidobacteraceae bacterium]